MSAFQARKPARACFPTLIVRIDDPDFTLFLHFLPMLVIAEAGESALEPERVHSTDLTNKVKELCHMGDSGAFSQYGINFARIVSLDDQTLFEMSLKYSVGDEEVERNQVLAHICCNLSALRGNLRAVEMRKELAAEMSEEEIAEARKVARFIKDNFLSQNIKN